MVLKRASFFDLASSLVLLVVVGVIAITGVGIYGYIGLSARADILAFDLASTTEALVETRDRVGKLEEAAQGLGNSLSVTKQQLAATASNVDAVKSQVGGVEATVGNISGTVTTLQKLSKTDPELLAKYSKMYFLNENYVPVRLAQIAPEYLYSENRPGQFQAEALRHLHALIDAGKSGGVLLYVHSAYRSFNVQESLKSAYRVTYGAGTANQFSADQGYSEHQLGTTVDFITIGLNGQLEGFEDTPAFSWLTANAYKYGFILSYPNGNSYYIFEPWHWRFVGIALATYLHDQNRHFYDMDQREIDEYLANIFD